MFYQIERPKGHAPIALLQDNPTLCETTFQFLDYPRQKAGNSRARSGSDARARAEIASIGPSFGLRCVDAHRMNTGTRAGLRDHLTQKCSFLVVAFHQMTQP
jgi:hypothetical protein